VALTRRLDTPAAQELARQGATLVQGRLDDRASLDRAIGGADAVFAMTTPFESGVEAEICQGRTVAEAARAAGAFLVFSSVSSADKKTGIPHFDSKYVVEEHLGRIGARATILRPVYFMENAVAFAPGSSGRASTPRRCRRPPAGPDRGGGHRRGGGDRPRERAALRGQGARPGRRLRLRQDAVEILSRVTGRKFTYYQVPMQAIRERMGEDGVRMYEYFEKVGYDVSLTSLQREFSEVRWHTFEAGRARWTGRRSSGGRPLYRRSRRYRLTSSVAIKLRRIAVPMGT
jgi:uncharacterized protein YbjT (DUF2867 family)